MGSDDTFGTDALTIRNPIEGGRSELADAANEKRTMIYAEPMSPFPTASEVPWVTKYDPPYPGALLPAVLDFDPIVEVEGPADEGTPYEFIHYDAEADATRLPSTRGMASVVYPILGMLGEAGEIANKYNKIVRDTGGVVSPEQRAAILDECGDVLWCLSALCRDLDSDLGSVARHNIQKLNDRKNRGVLGGSGDKR